MWIGFLKPQGDQGSLVNRIAAALSGGPFCHVEIVFEDMYTCSIAMSGSRKLNRVFLMRKTDFSEEWVFFRLKNIRPETERAIREFCEGEIGKPYAFTKCLMDMSYLGWAYTGKRDQSYYCSELVVAALKMGGYGPAQDLEPGALHPNGLYFALRDWLEPGYPTPEQQQMHKNYGQRRRELRRQRREGVKLVPQLKVT